MSRPAKAIIDLNALRNNLALARNLTQSQIVGVIKADAYGHGSIPVAQVLEQENIQTLAVACIEEAIILRESGITTPILLLEGFYGADELPLIERYNLEAVIQQFDQIEILEKYQTNKPINFWLKLDSGMHRIGFLPKEFSKAYNRLKRSENVGRLVLMTHFSRADEPECDYTHTQTSVFREAIAGLSEQTCLSNSAGLLHWPSAHGDWVRPGLLLYGASPFMVAHENADQLQPVMKLSSEIIAVRDLEAGMPIGYGATYVTDRPTRVGVVAIGYGDGYPRHAPSGAPVLVNNKRTRILGRISMDMMTIDLNHLPNTRIGDTVTLWGKGLPANEVAHHAGTIAYELFCNLKRVPVRYHGTESSKS